MELPARIRQWADWPGWRQHAPAAGSVVVHIVLGVAVAGLLAAVGKTLPPAVDPPERPVLEISLMTDSLPLPGERVKPPPVRAPKTPPPAGADTVPTAPAIPNRKDQARKAPDAPAPVASTGDGSVVLEPSPFAMPERKGGLDGLTSNDPCTARIGLKPKECGTDWAAAMGNQASVMPRSKEDMKKYYAEFMTPCPWKVGCEGGEWKSNNGTRSVFSPNGSPMMSGAGGLGGINELTGRLGFNPDHTDPGFGD
jgi:hypothetical protein